MNVDKKIWKERMNNLILRRKSHTPQPYSIVGDYKSHLSKVFVGKTVLDVGCGDMALLKFIPLGSIYVGIDAFPVNELVVSTTIEDCYFEDNSFETVFVFAALDNFYDLDKAFKNLKRIASKNIVFLTGVGIDIDKYHTFMIDIEMLQKYLCPPEWVWGYFERLEPKVILIEFKKV